LVLARRAGLLGVVVLALVAASSLAAIGTGTIRGRVTIDHPTTEGGTARPNVADLGMREAHGMAADEQRSVIYLETAPRGAFEDRSDARVRMDQRNETFLPHVLAIMTGTTVEFTNSDRTYHNVFSLSKAKRFDLGRYPRGRSRSVRFDQPGIVRVFCEIHSHMSAWILVFAHPFFATTDAEGRFRIEGVPPGSYTLAVWNDGAVRSRRELRVTSEGEAVELELAVE
jgi:plastocyanin